MEKDTKKTTTRKTTASKPVVKKDKVEVATSTETTTNNNKPMGKPNYKPNGFSQQHKHFKRKKFCHLCEVDGRVDYKDVELVSKYLTHNLKIASRKMTGACAKHQRRISNAIKRARIVALIPYIKD